MDLQELAATVDDLLREIGAELRTGEKKATVADFLRLLQLKRELDEEDVKHVEVRWVERLTPEREPGK